MDALKAAVGRFRAIKRGSAYLETSALVLAVGALLFRATIYWRMPIELGAEYGVGDIIDFVLGFVLFIICGLCAGAGVALSAMQHPEAQQSAYRPILIGITSFVVYYFVHPYVPRLL